MNWKEVIKRLMGKGSNIAYRDERGMPMRKATPDELELEQYEEEERRHKIKQILALKRRERLTKMMKYGAYSINLPNAMPKPKARMPKLKRRKFNDNILNWG